MKVFRKSLLLTVVLCAGLVPCGLGQEARAVPATEVIRYQVTATLPAVPHEGFCWTDSIAAPLRGDAWRCAEGNAIYDPCFGLLEPEAVVCGINPAKAESGFRLKLTKPLPLRLSHRQELYAQESKQDGAWLLELADGTVCSRFTGTRPFFGRQIAEYSCPSGRPNVAIVLLEGVDSRRPLWIARKAVLVNSGTKWRMTAAENESIKRAWQ